MAATRLTGAGDPTTSRLFPGAALVALPPLIARHVATREGMRFWPWFAAGLIGSGRCRDRAVCDRHLAKRREGETQRRTVNTTLPVAPPPPWVRPGK
jgi:hypothetical protein